MKISARNVFTSQILIEWVSRISTTVNAASPVAVACIRKNAPGTKPLSVKAVRAERKLIIQLSS